ncbi:MAG: hypothetical protein HFI52_04060 [Lachnospiraceae bacterium]|nr:hypothetical protein [Lachnospiraceae bacterium]
MDKYEYKIRADEINSLIEEGEYAEAVAIADTIDWRRVKSVRMLCTISDLYKINRRFQESKDILLLAYEKHPSGRLIVYSLCELSIKMEEYVQAIEYYKEFVQIAPKDTGRYILQYRLYEAQEVSLEERIAVLEEFKKRDYREKWAYELAYLYHRIGLTTKCIEECDEMYLWFGEGKYVIKAMELKALHAPLNAEQQAKYDAWTAGLEEDVEEADEELPEEDEDVQTDEGYGDEEADEEDPDFGMTMPTTDLPQVKTVDVGEYNTLNLQMALAESMKEIMTDEEPEIRPVERALEVQEGRIVEMPRRQEQADEEESFVEEEETAAEDMDAAENTDTEENLAEKEDQDEELSIVEKIIAPLLQETVKIPKVELPEETDELQEVVPEATREFTPVRDSDLISGRPSAEAVRPEAVADRTPVREIKTEPAQEQRIIREVRPETIQEPTPVRERMPEAVQEQMPAGAAEAVSEMMPAGEPEQPAAPTIYDSVLSQEYDGQIRLLVPDSDVKAVEKQITGQLSIQDIMAEWEAMKRSNEQKRMEDVRRRVLEHTGSLFADFDEATKSGLLEQLEKAFVAAIMKESGIKKVILPEEAEKELVSKTAQTSPQPAASTETARKEPVPVKEIEEAPVIAYNDEPDEEDADFEMDDEMEEVAEPDELEAEIDEPEEEEPEAQPQPETQTVRELTDEERELFGQFTHHRKSREQLVRTLDNMSMASYTGNVIITGEEGGGTLTLAKGLIREMQYSDGNFSGKIAKISGAVLNKKDIADTLSRISGGALIVEKAADLKSAVAMKLCKELERGNVGLLLILEDTKQRMNTLLSENDIMNRVFDLRVDIEPLDDEALVAYARQYAEDQEYSIDEFGVLALHTRIAEMQTSDHEVTLAEVRELVDEAIYYANRKTPKHFVDVLLSKRYDNDDMIILRESDFIHY